MYSVSHVLMLYTNVFYMWVAHSDDTYVAIKILLDYMCQKTLVSIYSHQEELMRMSHQKSHS